MKATLGGITTKSSSPSRTRCPTQVSGTQQIRSSAQVPCSVGNVVNSSLFINSSLSSLSSTSHAVWGGPQGGPQGVSGHRGVWLGGGGFHGGRGHFGPAAIYCTTTWCFALKGLRTRTAPISNCDHSLRCCLPVLPDHCSSHCALTLQTILSGPRCVILSSWAADSGLDGESYRAHTKNCEHHVAGALCEKAV